MSEVVKQNDTDPIVWAIDDANGPLDLTGATVTMKAYGPKPSTAEKFSRACVVLGKGKVQQTPAATDFNVVGHFDVTFLADWGSGRSRRVPSEGFLPLRVDPAAPA